MASISELLSSILQPVNNLMNSSSSTHSFRKPGYEAVAKEPQQPPLLSQPQQQAPVAAYPGYQQAQQRGGFDSPPQQFDFNQAGDLLGELATGAADLFKKFTAPAPTQGPKMWREPTNEVLSFNEQGQQVSGGTPAPTATPNPALDNGDYRFAYETLPRDEGWTENGPRPHFNPKQPPPDIGSLIREFFPNEATPAAAVFASENATFDPNRPDNINKKDGSADRGIPQINENTFNGLMQRQGGALKEMGINSFDDMRDPRKSLIVAKMIKEGSLQANNAEGRDTSGWGPWYGWQDTGFNLNKGWFSKEDRGQYEEVKKKKK